MKKLRNAESTSKPARVIPIEQARRRSPADRATSEVRDSEFRRLRDSIDAGDLAAALDAVVYLVGDETPSEHTEQVRTALHVLALQASDSRRKPSYLERVRQAFEALDPRSERDSGLGERHQSPRARFAMLESDVEKLRAAHATTATFAAALTTGIFHLFPNLPRATNLQQLERMIAAELVRAGTPRDVVRGALRVAGATAEQLKAWGRA